MGGGARKKVIAAVGSVLFALTGFTGVSHAAKPSVSGAVSAYAIYTSSTSAKKTNYDVSSALVTVSEKSIANLPVSYTVTAGAYAMPVVAVDFTSTADTTKVLTPLPIAYLEYASPSIPVTIDVGRMPTLIGYESAFTYQNDYVDRGLVWNMQPILHDGIRITYSGIKNITIKFGINDGYYSASVDTFDGKRVISPAIEGSISGSPLKDVSISFNFLIPTKSARPNETADPANKQEYNLVGSYSFGKLTVGWDALYVYAPKDTKAMVSKASSAYGIALHGEYAVNEELKLAGRIEYVNDDSGGVDLVGIGNGNSAFTITFSPCFTKGSYFLKGDLAYVKADNDFTSDNKDSLTRVAIEAGISF
ncbi:MAG: porin [Thermodesulfobacteria bacterium]|nr:porin [Thermodesulfobacteriota bacterium]